MAVIEGRVANFGELIESHPAVMGREFVIERVNQSLRGNLGSTTLPPELSVRLVESTRTFGHLV